MNDAICKLIKNLEELISFLEKYGEKEWTKWIIEARVLIEAGAFLKGVEKILRAYGGMGSIIDFGIDPENGHKVNGDLTLINKELMRLISNLYEQATKAKKKL